MPNIISRADARAKGLKRYFTGKPCKRGHVCERRCRDSDCVKCRSKSGGRRASNAARVCSRCDLPFVIFQTSQRYCSPKCRIASKIEKHKVFRRANPEKVREWRRQFRQNNPEKLRAYKRSAYQRSVKMRIRIRLKSKEWYEKNRERMRERYRTQRDKAALYDMERRP